MKFEFDRSGNSQTRLSVTLLCHFFFLPRHQGNTNCGNGPLDGASLGGLHDLSHRVHFLFFSNFRHMAVVRQGVQCRPFLPLGAIQVRNTRTSHNNPRSDPYVIASSSGCCSGTTSFVLRLTQEVCRNRGSVLVFYQLHAR